MATPLARSRCRECCTLYAGWSKGGKARRRDDFSPMNPVTSLSSPSSGISRCLDF